MPLALSGMEISEELRAKMIAEYCNWDAQLTKAESSELSSLEIERVKRAFAYLRDLLGESFPKDCFYSGTSINQYFLNRAPWTRVWFSWLAESIQALNSDVSRDIVITKLRSSHDSHFLEAVTILNVALKLAKAGIGFELDVDALNTEGRVKKPDFRIHNTGTGEYGTIEVTRLQQHPAFQKHDSLFRRAYFQGLQCGIPLDFSGILHKDVSDEHLFELQTVIDEKVAKAINHKTFEEISRPGVLDLAFAPRGDEMLIEWSKEKGTTINGYTSPSIDVLSKVRGKIINKKRQLSTAIPGILVIKIEGIWLNGSTFAQVEGELSETIHKCPELAAVVLISSEMGDSDKLVRSAGFNFYVERKERHLHSSKTLLMFNRFCKTQVSPHFLTRLFDAFEKY